MIAKKTREPKKFVPVTESTPHMHVFHLYTSTRTGIKTYRPPTHIPRWIDLPGKLGHNPNNTFHRDIKIRDQTQNQFDKWSSNHSVYRSTARISQEPALAKTILTKDIETWYGEFAWHAHCTFHIKTIICDNGWNILRVGRLMLKTWIERPGCQRNFHKAWSDIFFLTIDLITVLCVTYQTYKIRKHFFKSLL